ncbi:type II toxin-antitoxin system Phd/YefM family antitoxin [Pseudonocardia nigra]|uniref:type II toxin-antitoxin system Phd/YefM family antitoxin n=1 Tax=Pseudonocardia nigra TaxID=1921578 RepID=UPI001C5E83B1|nr:type II toxin-antitoxin system prevent-host-death family antitoxin [Pseudonocardia nigra]
MPETIGQRQLRNDNAEIMRRVEAGESFIVTRNGKAIADIVPHQAEGSQGKRRLTLRQLQERRRQMPHVDIEQWYADRAADDEVFGDDRIEY